MNNFNNILVGLDISNNAQEVLQRTFLVGQKNSSNVVIVHAIDVGFFGKFFSGKKINKLKEEALSSIEKNIANIDTMGLKYSIVVENALPSELIIKTAKDSDASLIIVRANEKKDLANTILGSTAHKVAQNSNLPILLVKNSPKEAYQNIVSFTDLSKASVQTLKFAQEFFHDEKVTCIYAHKQMSEIAHTYYESVENRDEIEQESEKLDKQKFDKFVAQNNIPDAQMIEDRLNVTSILEHYVNDNNNDLVVLGSSGVKTTGSFLYGSTASALMQSLKSDVLVYVPKS
jgi:nucleotide-binding universal stress UspA family protein